MCVSLLLFPVSDEFLASTGCMGLDTKCEFRHLHGVALVVFLFFFMGEEHCGRNLYSPRIAESSLSVKPHFPGKKSRVRCYAPCSPWHEAVLGHGPASETTYLGAVNVLQCAKKRVDLSKHLTTVGLILGLTLTFFIFDSVMFSVIHHFYFGNSLSVKETKELQVRFLLPLGSFNEVENYEENLLNMALIFRLNVHDQALMNCPSWPLTERK